MSNVGQRPSLNIQIGFTERNAWRDGVPLVKFSLIRPHPPGTPRFVIWYHRQLVAL